MAYSDTRDIGMPDFGDESHDGRLERVFSGYLDVDSILSTLVWRVWGTLKDALEVGQIVKGIASIGSLGERLKRDAGMLILLHVLDLFCQTAVPVGRHSRLLCSRAFSSVLERCVGDLA